MSITYGPINSWRLGTAVGLDLVYSDHTHCTFDCVYCPQSKRSQASSKRHWYVGISAVECALRSLAMAKADCVAFAGRGEPTAASNLAESIDLARAALGLPVVVATNASLLWRDDVQRDLGKADTVVAKLDAYDEESFQSINRPVVPCTWNKVVGGLREFRSGFAGTLVLQVVLTEVNKPHARDLAAIARGLNADEVQLCSRAPWREAQAVSPETDAIHGWFADLNARCVHTDAPSWALISDLGKIQASHPNAAVMLMGVHA